MVVTVENQKRRRSTTTTEFLYLHKPFTYWLHRLFQYSYVKPSQSQSVSQLNHPAIDFPLLRKSPSTTDYLPPPPSAVSNTLVKWVFVRKYARPSDKKRVWGVYSLVWLLGFIVISFTDKHFGRFYIDHELYVKVTGFTQANTLSIPIRHWNCTHTGGRAGRCALDGCLCVLCGCALHTSTLALNLILLKNLVLLFEEHTWDALWLVVSYPAK